MIIIASNKCLCKFIGKNNKKNLYEKCSLIADFTSSYFILFLWALEFNIFALTCVHKGRNFRVCVQPMLLNEAVFRGRKFPRGDWNYMQSFI